MIKNIELLGQIRLSNYMIGRAFDHDDHDMMIKALVGMIDTTAKMLACLQPEPDLKAMSPAVTGRVSEAVSCALVAIDDAYADIPFAAIWTETLCWSEDKKQEIRQLIDDRVAIKEIAQRHKVSEQAIQSFREERNRTKPISRTRWSKSEQETLRKLMRDCKPTYRQAAVILSRKFGRRISYNMISGAIHRYITHRRHSTVKPNTSYRRHRKA